MCHTEAEHPIRHLRVVPEPIGSLQPRLKIDNCRREQQGEKAFWETWTHRLPHPPTPSIIEKRLKNRLENLYVSKEKGMLLISYVEAWM